MQSCESNTKNDNSQPEHPFSQKGSFVEDYSEFLHNLSNINILKYNKKPDSGLRFKLS